MKSVFSVSVALLMLVSQAMAGTTCVVKSSGGGDDAANIVNAFKSCNNGGTVQFPKGMTYNLKSVVKVENVYNVNVDFQGTINLPKYNTAFEKEKAFFYIAGDKITWYGSGTFNGNGQEWYNARNRNAPPLFKPKASNSYFGGFKIIQAPRSHMSVNGCNNVVFENLNFNTVSSSSILDAHNTDAFDVSGSTNIVIQKSTIVNGDDCIAVNGGVKNLTVSNLDCTGSHGFSVGSLGKKGSAQTDVVSDLKFISNKCHNCQNGVRIKTWPGGEGSVSDVIFHDITLDNVENPIIVTTHYCDNNQKSYCTGEDSHSLTISGVTFSSISGTASSKGKPIINIDCSTKTPCSNFKLSDITVMGNSKTTKNVCTNLSGSSNISYCK